MITIYHNPRCSKSREALGILKNLNKEFEVREYLKNPLSEVELAALLDKLNMTPIELIRTDEKLWKDEYTHRDLSDQELIQVMLENPKLIQRPIVETNIAAVVGRPVSNIEKLF